MSVKFRDYFDEGKSSLGADGREALRAIESAYFFAGAVMALRSERGLTQRELAARAGVQQADISRIERGSLAPSTPTLMRILAALGARVVIELVPDAELDPSGQPVAPLVVDRRAG
ncbi:unannotated protein [freshwater metagenome]|uniref:Unannotated protein n=1 Tax=freshwater metagenome TaxID=449393 RepID=A0A6J7I3F0_9ZZZZ